MKPLAMLVAVLLLMGMTACSSKRKPLVPLSLVDAGEQPQAITLTEQGTQAYQAKQFEDAKKYFEQAVAAAPQSGQAHYNYALALNALGDSELARQHFLEASDLAPGDKIIWDSPALAPYGAPETENWSKDNPHKKRRRFMMKMPRF